jgi:hypothetical protein
VMIHRALMGSRIRSTLTPPLPLTSAAAACVLISRRPVGASRGDPERAIILA